MATMCGTCGGPVPARGRGRPAKFCSAACKAKAYRARKAAGASSGGTSGGGMIDRDAARLAAFHAAAVIESAMANGWETLDRYGADRPRVESALNALRAELDRRAGPAAQPPPSRTPVVPPPPTAPLTAPPTPPPTESVTEKAMGQAVPRDARRPPRGLLSEPLFRALAEAYGAGAEGLPYQRHRGAWPFLAEGRRGSGGEPFVTDRSPADGRVDADGRRWITAAGRAHAEQHAETYRVLYPLITLQPAPVTKTRTVTKTGTADDGPGGDVQGEPDAAPDEVPDRPVPSGRLREVARLGAGWATDDDDVLWWQRTTRVGSVAKAWPGSGWQARHSSGRRVTTGAGPKDRYPSRIKALAALAAEYDRARRERTSHTEMPVDGLPAGWRLTQTLAEYDDGRWRLIGPGGEIAGTVTRETYGGRRAEWRATAGDPARDTVLRTTVTADSDDPARGSDFDLFRTRAAAARALAAWHDPDLYDL